MDNSQQRIFRIRPKIYQFNHHGDLTVMKKVLVLACSLGIAISSCKPRRVVSAVADTGGGADGQACPNIDVMKVFEQDRAKAIRIMAFLYRMMLRGNSRAGMLFLAAVEGVKFEEYMEAVDGAIKGGKLLASAEGVASKEEIFSDVTKKADMDQAIAEDVEVKIMKEILLKAERGETVKMTEGSRGVNLAMMAQRFGEVAKDAIAADPSVKAELQTQFETMIETLMEVETSDAEQGNARVRTRLLLDQLVDASRYAGLETAVTDPATGQIKRVSAVSDMAFTKAYVAAMASMADSMLSANSKSQINKLDYFYRDFIKLSGNERIFEGTGLKELTEVLRKPGTEEYKKLQAEGKIRVGDKEVSLNDITNPDAIIAKLRESGRGELLMDAMRREYGKEKERTK